MNRRNKSIFWNEKIKKKDKKDLFEEIVTERQDKEWEYSTIIYFSYNELSGSKRWFFYSHFTPTLILPKKVFCVQKKRSFVSGGNCVWPSETGDNTPLLKGNIKKYKNMLQWFCWKQYQVATKPIDTGIIIYSFPNMRYMYLENKENKDSD